MTWTLLKRLICWQLDRITRSGKRKSKHLLTEYSDIDLWKEIKGSHFLEFKYEIIRIQIYLRFKLAKILVHLVEDQF